MNKKLILIILIVVISVGYFVYDFVKNRNNRLFDEMGVFEGLNKGKNQKEEMDNQQSTETGFKSKITQFNKPAENGNYKLISNSDNETELSAQELLQNGLYYKNTVSGELYYIIFEDNCSDQKIYKLKPLSGIENNNLFVYKKDGRYATDFKNVYFDEWQTDFDCSGDYELHILPGSDPKTFEPNIETIFDIPQGNTFRGLYSRDLKAVFYGAEILDRIDVKTFKISKDILITSDKNYVYLWNKIIPNADPSTYVVIRNDGSSVRGVVYGKDKNNVFVDRCLLKGVDSNSFENKDLKSGEFIDKFGVFDIKLYEERTEDSFEIVSCNVIRK